MPLVRFYLDAAIPSRHFSTMDDELRRQLGRYSAGATVQHAGIYSDFEVPSSREPLSQEIITKWVAPFYMWGIRNPDEFIARYAPHRNEVCIELCRTLLISFNWRPRIVAAYFAAIENFGELEEHIGRLFLRSDVCFSGQGYSLALAVFNTPKSINFLKNYLDHYLTRQDLWFEQQEAMAALKYTDGLNGTSNFEQHLPSWESFISDKPNRSLGKALERFRQDVANVERIRNANTDQDLDRNG